MPSSGALPFAFEQGVSPLCPTGCGDYPPLFRYSAMSGSASGGSIVVTQQGVVCWCGFNLRGRETLYIFCRVARGRLARLVGDVHFNLKCHRGTL
jgi:hypothetical protein